MNGEQPYNMSTYVAVTKSRKHYILTNPHRSFDDDLFAKLSLLVRHKFEASRQGKTSIQIKPKHNIGPYTSPDMHIENPKTLSHYTLLYPLTNSILVNLKTNSTEKPNG